MNSLLAIRAVLNIILLIVILSGSIACFLSKHNGITKILGVTSFFASLYVSDVIFISLVDVTFYPDIRYYNLVAWNVITVFLVISVIWLGIRILQDD